MSNQATIQATEFINLPQQSKTYGYRIYDDHGQAYDNTFESPIVDDMELLEEAMQSDDKTTVGIIDFIIETGKGMYINGAWYDWDEIKHLFEDRFYLPHPNTD